MQFVRFNYILVYSYCIFICFNYIFIYNSVILSTDVFSGLFLPPENVTLHCLF
jgi:hypothetical protein